MVIPDKSSESQMNIKHPKQSSNIEEELERNHVVAALYKIYQYHRVSLLLQQSDYNYSLYFSHHVLSQKLI